ncbi:MAG: lipoyl(octanoyl) transferase LipB [Anaerolineales bacterium]|nr:lipoyl(octanoyl) transferase LipB [Anaerolineales bacterium]
MQPAPCEVQWLGLVPYQQAWDLQNKLAAEIGRGERPPALLLLEHPHTYTFGRRGQINNLLWDEAELARRGVTVHWVDRGGDVTYHGPGQLVGYPLLPLGSLAPPTATAGDTIRLPRADYIGYLRDLEEVLIRALATLGVRAYRLEGLTGVWVDRKQAEPQPTRKAGKSAKIAAIGVKVDANGVTRHGFALNVNPQMEYWQGIIGCGLAGYDVTSLALQLPATPTMAEIARLVWLAFGEVFHFDLLSALPGARGF